MFVCWWKLSRRKGEIDDVEQDGQLEESWSWVGDGGCSLRWDGSPSITGGKAEHLSTGGDRMISSEVRACGSPPPIDLFSQWNKKQDRSCVPCPHHMGRALPSVGLTPCVSLIGKHCRQQPGGYKLWIRCHVSKQEEDSPGQIDRGLVNIGKMAPGKSQLLSEASCRMKQK